MPTRCKFKIVRLAAMPLGFLSVHL